MRISVTMLFLLINAISVSHAQEVINKPETPTISPEVRERLEKLSEQLRLLPDLAAVDVNNELKCNYVAVSNIGFKRSPETTVRVTFYEKHYVAGGYFLKANDEENITLLPLQPNSIILLPHKYFGRNDFAISYIVDPVGTVKEVSESNNEKPRYSCYK